MLTLKNTALRWGAPASKMDAGPSAETGVDWISVGLPAYSAAVELSFAIEPE